MPVLVQYFINLLRKKIITDSLKKIYIGENVYQSFSISKNCFLRVTRFIMQNKTVIKLILICRL